MTDDEARVRVIRIALMTGIAVAVLNFAAFGIMATHYGGVPGIPLFAPIPSAGPYFLDDHGHFTEVSRETFSFMIWQSRSLVFLWPMAMVFGWILKRKLKLSN